MPCALNSPVPSNALACSLVQQFVDSEIAFQFQVRPVIQRIAQRGRHGARPGEVFLVRKSVAGALAFRHPVGPHGAPFVVIAFQPDLEKILEAPVFRHILGRQMAMIIQNRLVLGELVIQPPRGLGVEQEIFVDKRHRERQ
jgi:hypothetical protein